MEARGLRRMRKHLSAPGLLVVVRAHFAADQGAGAELQSHADGRPDVRSGTVCV